MPRPCHCDRCPKDGPYRVPTWRKVNGKMVPPPGNEQDCFDCWRFHTQPRWRKIWSGETIAMPNVRRPTEGGQPCCGGTPANVVLAE